MVIYHSKYGSLRYFFCVYSSYGCAGKLTETLSLGKWKIYFVVLFAKQHRCTVLDRQRGSSLAQKSCNLNETFSTVLQCKEQRLL